ncbi:peptidoglycan glycosyltransferase FtsW [Nitrosophilus alvini]|uniref:peptidoglycan glycosyltransferase FtsW n=1 Tax=Nitrosophilus alvini TaxID=2714855 RepID=UPI00190A348F|nr:putative peptidoglycan glycosyltransferase FtsW [Nitrosophilus alvini]
MVDRTLFILAAILITTGIVCSYSFTTYTILHYGYNEFHFVVRQLIAGIGAIFIMWWLSRRDPAKWTNYLGISIFLIFFILMFIMYFLPSNMVTSAGGAKRWIRFPGFSLAPVEFFKVGFVYFLAWSFSRKFSASDKPKNLIEEIKLITPYLFVFFIAVLLIAVLQNDLGQVMVLGLTLSIMLFFAGRTFKLFATLIGIAFTLFVVFIFVSEHRIIRIKMWWANAQNYILNFLPETLAEKLKVNVTEEPYQISHSLNAIHHGGITGTGLSEGSFKLGFLSEIHTDFVLSGIAEEFGFIGVFAVTLVVVLLIHRIFRIANRSEEPIDYLFCIGVALLIGFSFMMNAYGISGITPIKGIAVPFLSYGGSAMLANGLALGMVLMISKKVNSRRIE